MGLCPDMPMAKLRTPKTQIPTLPTMYLSLTQDAVGCPLLSFVELGLTSGCCHLYETVGPHRFSTKMGDAQRKLNACYIFTRVKV